MDFRHDLIRISNRQKDVIIEVRCPTKPLSGERAGKTSFAILSKSCLNQLISRSSEHRSHATGHLVFYPNLKPPASAMTRHQDFRL